MPIHKLRPTQKLILSILQHSESLTLGQIIDLAVINPSTAVHSIRTLLRLNLVTRHGDSGCHRYSIAPQEKGN